MSRTKVVIISRWQPYLDRMIEAVNANIASPDDVRIDAACRKLFGNAEVPFTFSMSQGSMNVGGVSDCIYYHDLPHQLSEDVEIIDPPGFTELLPGIYEEMVFAPPYIHYEPTDEERAIVEKYLVKDTRPTPSDFKPFFQKLSGALARGDYTPTQPAGNGYELYMKHFQNCQPFFKGTDQ